MMPILPKRICPYPGCSTLTAGGRCENHPTKHGWSRDRGTTTERGYGAEWVKLRAQVMIRDSYLCQTCLRHNKVTAASEVDHMIPKAQGGTDSMDNLEGICTICHRYKTLNERVTSH